MERGRCLQRSFSTFPAGLPGSGLLLLRMAVGLTAIFHAGSLLFSGSLSGLSWLVALAGAASGVLILIGLVTPLASVTMFILTLAAWIVESPPHESLRLPVPAMTCAIVITAALVLLGPGAYSVDARMFGRREIVIPKSSEESKK